MSERLAVVGAGWLGREVARRASEAGWHVRATTRSGRWRGSDVPDGIELSAFDLVGGSDDDFARLLDGCTAAVFSVAPSSGQDRRALYVDGARRIAARCRALPLQRVVYTSSTSALGPADGRADETSDTRPVAPRGQIQREAEETLADGLEGSSVPWTILRLAGLYGPDRPLRRIYRVDDVERIRPGDGHEHTNLIHLDDATTAVLAALTLDASERGVIHVCDDDHRTRRTIAAAVAAAHGCPPPRWEERAPDGPPRGKWVANDRMKQRLGVSLRHPAHRIEDDPPNPTSGAIPQGR